MSARNTIGSHIAYELIDDRMRDAVLVEFVDPELTEPQQRASWVKSSTRCFGKTSRGISSSTLGTSGALDSAAVRAMRRVAHRVDRLFVCNVRDSMRLGTGLGGLDDCAEFVADRRTAINEARKAAMGDEEETVDYPVWSPQMAAQAAYHRS